MFILNLLKVFSWIIILLSLLISTIIATSPFPNQIIIPDLIIEWGYDPISLTNHTVLWLLFILTLFAGSSLATVCYGKEKKTETITLIGGLLLMVGSLAGLFLLLNEISILIAQTVVSLWFLLLFCYALGLYFIKKNMTGLIQKIKQKQQARLVVENPYEDQDTQETRSLENDSDYR